VEDKVGEIECSDLGVRLANEVLANEVLTNDTARAVDIEILTESEVSARADDVGKTQVFETFTELEGGVLGPPPRQHSIASTTLYIYTNALVRKQNLPQLQHGRILRRLLTEILERDSIDHTYKKVHTIHATFRVTVLKPPRIKPQLTAWNL
jgi:hypothetical protein